jgi:hypothetical protein
MRLRFYIGLVCAICFYLGAKAHADAEKMTVKVDRVQAKDNRRDILAVTDLNEHTIGLLAYACGALLDFRIDKQYFRSNPDEVAKFIDEAADKVCK